MMNNTDPTKHLGVNTVHTDPTNHLGVNTVHTDPTKHLGVNTVHTDPIKHLGVNTVPVSYNLLKDTHRITHIQVQWNDCPLL
jgi:hypothetical protein